MGSTDLNQYLMYFFHVLLQRKTNKNKNLGVYLLLWLSTVARMLDLADKSRNKCFPVDELRTVNCFFFFLFFVS